MSKVLCPLDFYGISLISVFVIVHFKINFAQCEQSTVSGSIVKEDVLNYREMLSLLPAGQAVRQSDFNGCWDGQWFSPLRATCYGTGRFEIGSAGL